MTLSRGKLKDVQLSKQNFGVDILKYCRIEFLLNERMPASD